jgi:protein-tyrosine phosphatase
MLGAEPRIAPGDTARSASVRVFDVDQADGMTGEGHPPGMRSSPVSPMLPSRHIELPGCSNLRELGGYRTRRGSAVKWRRLYRGGELSRLSPEAASYLVHDLGIRRVVDLRTVAEIRDAVCPLAEPCRSVSVPLLASLLSHWVDPSDQGPEATASRYLEMVEQGLPAIGHILELLGTPPWRPTLLHCAAGRDRTGIVVALILDLLEVPQDVIAADYALSDGVIDDGARAYAETIPHLLNQLRERHSSSRELLLRSGVAPGCIERLGHLLLEPPAGVGL